MADYNIAYGPNENCTLAICSVKDSVYEYRPSLAASSVIIALFGLSMIIHIVQGIRWRTWFFLGAMILGCVCELVGYGGRIMLYLDPFTFPGFLMQIICITFAPAYFSAAIYVTLSNIITFLDPSCSRFRPSLYYWIFIPCDLVSLTLQAAGGGLSSSTSGSSKTGVDIAIAGLSFQVFTLTVFIILSIDYAVRYRRSQRSHPRETPLPSSFRIFLGFLCLAILCILIRCAYRIDELSNGYSGPLIHNQGLFIGLEGVMIVIAVYSLNIAHPGPVFGKRSKPSLQAGHGGDKYEQNTPV